MKKFIFSSLLALVVTNVSSASVTCLERVHEHMDLVTKSNEFIDKLSAHASVITSYEVTLLQKNLTKRYNGLKALQALYEKECAPKVLATSVAIFDFSSMGKNVFENPDLRRVVKGFKKYPAFGLSDYIKQYEYYTSAEVIEDAKYDIEQAGDVPDEFQIKVDPFENDYDPNLYALSDSLINGATSVVAGGARIWGFISDKLKWRSGRLNQNSEIRSLVESKLKPLDLVFEKRTFVLSNYTIPGHWGHVGVWLGTKEELIALNIWDQDYFKPFQRYVLEGKKIIEVRKQGANFQGLDTFLNLDEFAITRFTGITANAAEIYKEIFFQVGKRYDFKFDARTADKVTCSELITFSYGDIKWPESKTLFQVTLRPDDIGRMTLDADSNEEFVLYVKGNKDSAPSILDFNDWKKVLTPKKKKKKAKTEMKHADFEVYGG